MAYGLTKNDKLHVFYRYPCGNNRQGEYKKSHLHQEREAQDRSFPALTATIRPIGRRFVYRDKEVKT